MNRFAESGNYGSRRDRGDVIFRYNCSDSSSWTTSGDNGSELDIQLYSPEGSVPRDVKVIIICMHGKPLQIIIALANAGPYFIFIVHVSKDKRHGNSHEPLYSSFGDEHY